MQFIKDFPDRYIQCGIAEANMIGIAAGLDHRRKNPLYYDFCQLFYWSRIRSDQAISGPFR